MTQLNNPGFESSDTDKAILGKGVTNKTVTDKTDASDTGSVPMPVPDHGERTYHGSGRLAGKRVLITGGATGIGRAVAIACLREGADVALCYHECQEQQAREVKQFAREAWRRCLLLPGSTCDEGTCADMVEQTVENLGGVDVLVLNVGTPHGSECEPITEATRESVIRMFMDNLVAPLLITRESAPHLKTGSSIIITASIQSAHLDLHTLDHALTKSALVAFTHALASEMQTRGVRVNAIVPGPVFTEGDELTEEEAAAVSGPPQTPAGGISQPGDLAGAYVYLASDDAQHVTGSVMTVGGE